MCDFIVTLLCLNNLLQLDITVEYLVSHISLCQGVDIIRKHDLTRLPSTQVLDCSVVAARLDCRGGSTGSETARGVSVT